MIALRLLGFMIFGYVVYAIIQGKVLTWAGIGGRMVARDESPDAFWLTVASYIGVSMVLCAVF